VGLPLALLQQLHLKSRSATSQFKVIITSQGHQTSQVRVIKHHNSRSSSSQVKVIKHHKPGSSTSQFKISYFTFNSIFALNIVLLTKSLHISS
jgi:hypothetical protein